MARIKTPSSSKQNAPAANSTPAASTAAVPNTAVSTLQAAAENLKKETPKVEPKKLEIVKADTKKIVPINLDDEIRRRAYELSERRGFETGHENEDWLNAEREVLQRYHQQSA